MKRFSEQLHTKATNSVKLQAAEKRELRERVVSYMEYHPLPAEMKSHKTTAKAAAAPLFTDSFTTVSFPFATFFKSSAVAAALVLVVVPVLAEQSVPGDTLYGVKVQFNEELRGTLAFSSYQKVEWETERLNRRIAEARLLASEGRLTEAVEAEVAQAVRQHTQSAREEIEVMRMQDADEAAIAAIAFNTTLEAQSTSLRGPAEDATTLVGMMTAPAVDSMRRPTDLIASVIDESRSEAEIKTASSTPPAYNKLMARVELNTTRVYELLNSLEESVDAEQQADVRRRVEDVERRVQAVIDSSDKDEVETRHELVEILRSTQKLIVYMTELMVVNSVDIETLVPIVLTEEEKELVTANLQTEIAARLTQIDESIELVDDADVREKIESASATIATLSEDIASTTDFAQVQALAREAYMIADDTLLLIEQYVTVSNITPDESATSTEGSIEDSNASQPDDTSTTTSTTTEPEFGISTGTVDSQ